MIYRATRPFLAVAALAVAALTFTGLPGHAHRSRGSAPRPAPKFTAEDERFMRVALQAGTDGVRGGGFPFGAAIVRDGKVVSTAGNSVRRDVDATAHAEMQAIRDACKALDTRDLSACTIYATGEPCPMCFSACFWAKIPRIVFGARIADIRKVGIRQLMISADRMKSTGKVPIDLAGDCLREENLALLRLWPAQSKP